MGFISDLMTKLFGGQIANAQADWEQNMTLKEIEALEKQGCDVTELKANYYERVAREEAEERAALEMLDFMKLDAYRTLPRTDETFLQGVITLNKISAKRIDELREAPLHYGAVVQAHYALWEPGTGGNMGVVLVMALDEQHRYDMDWLKSTAEKISEMKESSSVPADCKKFIKTLQDDQSVFCFKLGESLSQGADAWCFTYTVDDKTRLPGNRLPANRIVPFLLTNPLKDNRIACIELIPAQYYTK